MEEPRHRPIPYGGPTDFEKLSDFLGDLSKGGMSVLQFRKAADEKQKEIGRLKGELERERESVAIAQAEIARNMLGQVGHDAAIKKDLQDAKDREKAKDLVADELRAEREALLAEVKALREVQQARVVKLRDDNVDVFLSSTTRPLKAVLFTTKTETPPLWQQLAEAQVEIPKSQLQFIHSISTGGLTRRFRSRLRISCYARQSTTTAFAVVHHVETALMKKFALDVSDLPRICIYSTGKEPVVYDGECVCVCEWRARASMYVYIHADTLTQFYLFHR